MILCLQRKGNPARECEIPSAYFRRKGRELQELLCRTEIGIRIWGDACLSIIFNVLTMGKMTQKQRTD